MSSWPMGEYVCEDPHHAVLHRAMEHVFDDGSRDPLALEFGVGSGGSLRCIARRMRVVGFDSFLGLPEDWREGFPAGSFRHDPPLSLPCNAHVVQKMFSDINEADYTELGPLRLVHLDADLYASTLLALESIPYELEGAYLVFDEFWNYPGCEDHEQRAWLEFSERRNLSYEVVGHGDQQWAVKIK